MKRTRQRRTREALNLRHLNTAEEIAQAHRFCVSYRVMQRGYANSNDFELCDEDGTINPLGLWYRSKRTEKVKKIEGECSLRTLPNGKPNPAWNGCPHLNTKHHVLPPPTLEAIEKHLDESPEEEDAFERLERILEKMKNA